MAHPPGAPSAAPVVVLVAHPALQHSHVNAALIEAARTVPGADVRDLYALYPDFVIDVEAEQRALAGARLVVWQQPIHWYGMTPMLRLWADEVLAFGWAYGPGGDALRGKDLWLVGSTGGAEASYHPRGYNRYRFEAFLPPYEQTAVACGLRFLPPWLLHGAHRMSATEIAAAADVYAQRLATHPDWPELDELESCPACEVPLGDRPLDEEVR